MKLIYNINDLWAYRIKKMNELVEKSDKEKQAIAKAMGIRPGDLCNILKGERSCSETLLFRFADAVNVPNSVLVNIPDNLNPSLINQ